MICCCYQLYLSSLVSSKPPTVKWTLFFLSIADVRKRRRHIPGCTLLHPLYSSVQMLFTNMNDQASCSFLGLEVLTFIYLRGYTIATHLMAKLFPCSRHARIVGGPGPSGSLGLMLQYTRNSGTSFCAADAIWHRPFSVDVFFPIVHVTFEQGTHER